jgi:type VI secretion system protein ImpK
MTPEFSKIVDPVILGGLALLERIERNQQEPITVEHENIKKQIDRGDQAFGPMSNDWQLAKYALVAWLDEQLVSFPWDGREWWTNHILERHYFTGRREAFEDFFVEANRAATLSSKDALEVFHTVVLLGYRGIYSKPLDSEKARAHQLPKRLEDWVRNTAGVLARGPELEFESAPQLGDGASPLDGRLQFASMCIVGLISLIAAASYYFLLFDRGLFD